MYNFSFEDFYKQTYKRMYVHALSFLGDESEAEDVLSEAYTILWEKMNTIDKSSWQPYLYIIIKNKCIDRIRQSNIIPIHFDELAEALPVELSDYKEYEEKLIRLERHINELPKITKAILNECYYHQKTYKQVAMEQDISVHTVKRHIMCALRFLRNKYRKG